VTVPLDEEDSPEIPDSSGTPETLFIGHAQEQMLQSAMEELPVHFREILLLVEVEEMSYQEISETLAIPMGTVMSRLSRARKGLREILKGKVKA
jgi:RNA polymerase sigma-70 factor (ECF subfamily)